MIAPMWVFVVVAGLAIAIAYLVGVHSGVQWYRRGIFDDKGGK